MSKIYCKTCEYFKFGKMNFYGKSENTYYCDWYYWVIFNENITREEVCGKFAYKCEYLKKLTFFQRMTRAFE